jgi:DNA polymerase-3 subunit gamma/tau
VADRCHRFDFSRPAIAQIAGVLRRVAGAEGITVPEEALALIARSATGSFRDALGTLEQLVAYSGTTVALDDVLAVLGAVDADLLFGTIDAVAAGNAREALLAAARLADSGRDVGRFFADLEAHLRALMVVQTLGGEVPAELAMTADHDERLRTQAARVPGSVVTRLLDLLALGLRAMKDGADARTQLELALVKAADPARDASSKALLARLERLERGGAVAAPAAPVAVHAPEQPATAAGQVAAQRGPIAATVVTEDGPAAVAAVSVPAPETAEAAQPGEPAVAVAVAPVEGELDGESLRELWPAILEQLPDHLSAFLAEAVPVGFEDERLVVAWSESAALMMKQADRPANREQISEAVRTVTGRVLRLAYELRSEDELAEAGGDADPALSEDELIQRFVTEFDATVLDDGEDRS